MPDDVPPLPIPVPVASRPSAWRIVGGLSFLLAWAVIHYLIFLLLAGGGFVIELLLSIVKSIMFPGKKFTEHLDISTWTTTLTVGVIIAGLAGIPATMAIIRQRLRKTMILWFLIAMIVGIGWEAVAFYRFLASSLSIDP